MQPHQQTLSDSVLIWTIQGILKVWVTTNPEMVLIINLVLSDHHQLALPAHQDDRGLQWHALMCPDPQRGHDHLWSHSITLVLSTSYRRECPSVQDQVSLCLGL